MYVLLQLGRLPLARVLLSSALQKGVGRSLSSALSSRLPPPCPLAAVPLLCRLPARRRLCWMCRGIGLRIPWLKFGGGNGLSLDTIFLGNTIKLCLCLAD